LAVVVDHQTNGAATTGATIWNTDMEDFYSFRNLSQVRRFTVLKDLYIPWTRYPEAAANFPNRRFIKQLYIRFPRPIRIDAPGNNGNITDITNNSIQIFVCKQHNNDSAVTITSNSTLRIRFTDNPGT
jgi:hypothetical protein